MLIKKNRNEETSSSEEEYGSDNSDSDIDSEGNYIGENQIEAIFEGRNPEDCDYHGIKALLRQLFLKANVDIAGLAQLIISQNYVGSVIKQCLDDEPMSDDDDDDDDEDDGINGVFGLTTLLNITQRKDTECIQQIRSLLQQLADENIKQECEKKLFQDILGTDEAETNHVGLLINERIVNIPAAISVPVFESLKSEIEKANKKNMKYTFKYIIWISKIYCDTQDISDSSEVLWANSEECDLLPESIASFNVDVSQQLDDSQWEFDGVSMKPFRKIMLFDGNKLDRLIDCIKSHVDLLKASTSEM